MKAFTKILAGGVGLAAVVGAAPAAAQYYPNNPYPGYGYGYGQGGLGAIIDQILGGNRYAYGVDQRQLVERCIAAVTNDIARRYASRGYGYGYGGQYGAPYGSPYGYNQGASARVLGITDIDRRSRDLRVRGTATAGGYAAAPYGAPYGSPYGSPYGYGYQAPQVGELQFECNVDYRGRIRDIDIERNRYAYGYRR